MTPEEGNQVAYAIYQRIFKSLTSPADGQPAVFDAPNTYLCLQLPAQAVSVKDFTNAWTPANRSGSQDAARNFADLVDVIPTFSPRYVDSGRRISHVYGQIINGARVKDQPLEPEWQKQYDDSYAKLYRKVQQTDPETGEVTERVVPTKLYSDYKRNKAAYDAARAAYIQVFVKAQSTPEGRETWPLLASTLEGPVRDAFDQLQTDGADEAEGAIAAHARAQGNLVGRAFQDAQFIYNNAFVSLEGAGSKTWRAAATPSDWFDPDGGAGWTSVSFDHSDFTANSSTESTSWGAQAGVSVGLWSFGASAGGSEDRQHSDTDSSTLSIAYDFTTVAINRTGWLDASLLSLQHWDMADMYAPGGVSQGPGNDNSKAAWPLLPVSFIAIKNLSITAQWGHQDSDRIQKSINAGGSIGFGPFSLGGNYSHSSTNDHYRATFDGSTVHVGTVQVIGWVSQILPFAPPAAV
jgi:hypothetical protein